MLVFALAAAFSLMNLSTPVNGCGMITSLDCPDCGQDVAPPSCGCTETGSYLNCHYNPADPAGTCYCTCAPQWRHRYQGRFGIDWNCNNGVIALEDNPTEICYVTKECQNVSNFINPYQCGYLGGWTRCQDNAGNSSCSLQTVSVTYKRKYIYVPGPCDGPTCSPEGPGN